jgi:flagellar L-ring protein precursor FlgH
LNQEQKLMNKMITVVSVALMVVQLSGCVTNPERHRATWEPVVPPAQPKKIATNGSIYQASREDSFFTNDQARRVGDIITVKLSESMSASKTASSSATKEDINAIPAVAMITSNPLLQGMANGTSTKEFSGDGSAAQSNSLTGDITVTVIEVYPNGNLRVRGEKQVTINQGDELIRVSGVVRVADITSENTVLSTQVADAQIVYVGNGGMIANANTQGILGQFFMSALWPF